MDNQAGEKKQLPTVERDDTRDLLERRGRKEVTQETQLLSYKLSKRAAGPASRKTDVSSSSGRGFKRQLSRHKSYRISDEHEGGSDCQGPEEGLRLLSAASETPGSWLPGLGSTL